MAKKNLLQELIELLRKLKLHGMANCLLARNEEATSNQMIPTEFLRLLLEDETIERDQRRYERQLKRANFRDVKTIENFDFSFNPKIKQQQIRDLATCHFITEKQPVMVIGPCGTGKTHLASIRALCFATGL